MAPKIPTPDQWRYEKYAESLTDTILRDPETYHNRENLQSTVLCVLERVFEQAQEVGREAIQKAIDVGYEAGFAAGQPVIPISDYSDAPDIAEAFKAKGAQN